MREMILKAVANPPKIFVGAVFADAFKFRHSVSDNVYVYGYFPDEPINIYCHHCCGARRYCALGWQRTSHLFNDTGLWPMPPG